MVLVPVTILGGLPVIARISSGKDEDTPNGPGEYWMEVDNLYWQRRDGACGSEVSKAIYDRCDKHNEWWSADVTEEANDWLAYNCPVRVRDHTVPGGYRERGEWTEDYIKLNGDPRAKGVAA